MSTKKTQSSNFLLLLLSFVVIFAVAVIRFLSPEDDWVCQNGNWVKHGNPSAAKPTEACLAGTISNVVYVYYSNTQKSGENYDCGLVYPIERITATSTPQVALTELFNGPTATEKSLGYSSFFSEKTKSILKSVKVENSIAYVDLTDIRKIIPNVSASCGSKQFIQQIKLTLMRTNSNITDVRFAINGNPQAFYNWIQVGCDKKLNNCDPKPFQ